MAVKINWNGTTKQFGMILQDYVDSYFKCGEITTRFNMKKAEEENKIKKAEIDESLTDTQKLALINESNKVIESAKADKTAKLKKARFELTQVDKTLASQLKGYYATNKLTDTKTLECLQDWCKTYKLQLKGSKLQTKLVNILQSEVCRKYSKNVKNGINNWQWVERASDRKMFELFYQTIIQEYNEYSKFKIDIPKDIQAFFTK